VTQNYAAFSPLIALYSDMHLADGTQQQLCFQNVASSKTACSKFKWVHQYAWIILSKLYVFHPYIVLTPAFHYNILFPRNLH